MRASDMILEYLDAPTLREWASIKEASDPERIARSRLSPEGIERFAEIALAGSKPTIGFWLRYRRVS